MPDLRRELKVIAKETSKAYHLLLSRLTSIHAGNEKTGDFTLVDMGELREQEALTSEK